MTCEGNVCGTGNYTGPKPGDPDNNITMSAQTVFNGIKVHWNYPNTNRAAVGFFTLYRGTTPNLPEATELAVVSSSIYYDQIDVTVPTRYYYWVRMTTINATVYDPVGPVSAEAVPRKNQSIEDLTGMIDKGLLATALKTEIGGILDNRNDLLKEIQDRYGAESEIALALQALQNNVDGAFTYVGTATAQHQSELEAMSSRLDLTAASLNETKGAVLEETLVRVAENAALASKITAVEVALEGNEAGAIVEIKADIDAITGQISAMYTAKVQVNGLIGGFGIVNDGNAVEAGFDVDRFWVGRTNDNKVKPFIVAGGVVYIDEARIRNASIDTLKLKGEAVTVPVVSNVPATNQKGKGEGTWTRVNEAYMVMDQAGLLYILHTSAQGFIQNQRYWSFQIRVNGATVRSIMGRQPNDAPVLSASLALPVGTHRVEVYWSGHPDVILGYSEIFMMGVKK